MDPVTAESEQADADFAAEHQRPTFADEPSTEGPDESVPTGYGGMDIDQGQSGAERKRHEEAENPG
jgi:hypothetical protein